MTHTRKAGKPEISVIMVLFKEDEEKYTPRVIYGTFFVVIDPHNTRTVMERKHGATTVAGFTKDFEHIVTS